jgi:hypothetical protein
MRMVGQQIGLVHIMLPGPSKYLDTGSAGGYSGLQVGLQGSLPGWRLTWPDGGCGQVDLACSSSSNNNNR